jgi:hypothetical protein
MRGIKSNTFVDISIPHPNPRPEGEREKTVHEGIVSVIGRINGEDMTINIIKRVEACCMVLFRDIRRCDHGMWSRCTATRRPHLNQCGLRPPNRPDTNAR